MLQNVQKFRFVATVAVLIAGLFPAATQASVTSVNTLNIFLENRVRTPVPAELGLDVSPAGDVNGDGYDDFLLFAARNVDGVALASLDRGAIYLVYGGAQFVTTSLYTATEFTTMASAASAGDVNGDGYDDLVLGNFRDDDGGTQAGAAYIVYGQAEPLASSAISTATKFTGEQAGDYAGYSVSSAGDVNGDGYDDVLIGAHGNDVAGVQAGAVFVVYGQSAQLASASLSTAVKFTGEQAGDYAGYSVSSAGDVNGDGYDDVLVGAYNNDAAGSNAGAAYLIYAQSATLISGSLSTAVKFTGEQPADYAGYSVSSAGDVNGDGYDDMLIGAYYNDAAGSSAGAAHLVYGQSATLASSSLLRVAKFTGEQAGDKAGISVSSAGDVNGDGYDDMLVGAYFNDANGSNAGAAYLIYGQSATLVSGSLSQKIKFSGLVGDDYAGQSVSSAGDVNGDGYDDMLVGAPGSDVYAYGQASGIGAVYLVNGQSSTFVSAPLSQAAVTPFYEKDPKAFDTGKAYTSAGDVNGDGYDDFLIAGVTSVYLAYGQTDKYDQSLFSGLVEFVQERTGDLASTVVSPTSIASAGDVNGDGYDDILIGAPNEDTIGSNAGATYLIYGQSTKLKSILLSSAVKFTGEKTSDYAGYSVSSTGDVNGDGYDDMLVGAHLNDDGASNAGAAYLIYGQSAQLASASLSTAVQFTGEVPSDFAGSAVSSAGDVNGDGYDDMLIGAYGNDDAGSGSGAAYLIYGQSAQLASASLSTVVEFKGEKSQDAAGGSVASAGDVNGDGYDDMLVGARLNDDGAINAGATYLIYGQSAALVSASLSTAVQFSGEVGGDNAGSSVASAGDVNGDGYDDILIGAPGQDNGNVVDSGATYLIYGQSATLTSVPLSTVNKFTGPAIDAYTGTVVASAGDVNGDGKDDILIRGKTLSTVNVSMYLGYM